MSRVSEEQRNEDGDPGRPAAKPPSQLGNLQGQQSAVEAECVYSRGRPEQAVKVDGHEQAGVPSWFVLSSITPCLSANSLPGVWTPGHRSPAKQRSPGHGYCDAGVPKFQKCSCCGRGCLEGAGILLQVAWAEKLGLSRDLVLKAWLVG